MKIAIAAITLLSLTACDGMINPESTDLVQPDHYWELDGWGTNPDIYEFTPRGNPSYTCMLAVGGDDRTKGVFCIPKAGAA